MKNQISIIGLGQIGASFGLALEEYSDKILRVGFDSSRAVASQAKQIGAVDQTPFFLRKVVKQADLVILALPLHEIKQTLADIAEDLPQGALVIDTSPIKQPVIGWTEELLPEGISYVGLMPALQAGYLEESGFGIEAARGDLFQGCQMAVIIGKDAPSEAVDAATSLIGLVGAEPIFTDPAEIDGLMSKMHILPQVMAASLLGVTMDAPGWSDARKISGKPYTQVTIPLVPDQIPASLASSLFHNKENTIRLINDLISGLIHIRDLVDEADEDLLFEEFAHLQQARDVWWQDRVSNRWIDQPEINIPKEGMLKTLLGFRLPSQRNKETDSE